MYKKRKIVNLNLAKLAIIIINKDSAARCIAKSVRPLFLTLFITFCFFAPAAFARQPILEERETASAEGMQLYENRHYGFKISRPSGFEVDQKHGGAVSFVPRKSEIYRFIPSLTVTKFFVIKSMELNNIINSTEKKYSKLPFYRLNYISRGADTSEARICREFVDDVVMETVYEVSLYKKNGESLFEATWQAPKSQAMSQLAKKFEMMLSSFVITDQSFTTDEIAVSGSVNNPAELVSAALASINASKFLEALSALKRITALDANNLEAYVLTGKCYISLKDYKRASTAYKKLTELKPENLDFLNLYVDTLTLSKDYKKALAACKKALEINGPDQAAAMAYINLGNIFYGMGLLEEATNSYLEGITRHPNNAGLHNNAALIYTKRGDYASAISYYNKAIALEPEHRAAHLGIARIYFKQGNMTAAVFHYDKMAKLDPELEEPYTSLLKIYKKMNMPKNASDLLNELKLKNERLYKKVTADYK